MEDQPTTDNLEGAATGHRAEGRGPRRDRTAIHVVDRTAHALIFGLAVGGGVLHEAGGVDVLLARVVVGRDDQDWRLHGNLLFQAPRAANRDAVDLISSVGWARRLNRTVSLGVEGIGEDLEGFWNPAEAEGGARLLIGPSLHVAPAGRRWQLSLAGGPMFHPSDSGRFTNALRDLPSVTRATRYEPRLPARFKS